VIWRRAGLGRFTLSGGSPEGAREASRLLDPIRPWTDAVPELEPDTVLVLGVPDDAIEPVAAGLRGAPIRPDTLVLHLSGRLGREALDPLQPKTPHLAAFHPLRAFPSRDPGLGDLDGALVATDRRPEDAERVDRLAVFAGGEPVLVLGQARALYHAGAFLAGNALLALFAWGAAALERAGLDPRSAREALLRLAGTTLQAARAMGPGPALTGPVSRGDAATLAAHREALKGAWPARERLHRDLVRLVADLAVAHSDVAAAARVQDFLEDRS
jgi:predicted short-subunit dehydrogenase-like oxidoreductase (DUF2520 family)